MSIVFLILITAFITFVIFDESTSIWDVVKYLSYFFMALAGFYFLRFLLLFFPSKSKEKRNADPSNHWSADSGSSGNSGYSNISDNENHSSFWDWISGDSSGSDGGDSGGSDGGGGD